VGIGSGPAAANATIINSGTVVTTGTTSLGINSSGANATITNSGTVISEQSRAINFNQGGATLNLLAGTAIQGGVFFSGGGNTVTFGPGLNALMTFTGAGIPGTVETSGNPYVVNGNTIAVLDRAGFVLTGEMALALAGDVAGGGRRAVRAVHAGGRWHRRELRGRGMAHRLRGLRWPLRERRHCRSRAPA